jgi:hypothetical protein
VSASDKTPPQATAEEIGALRAQRRAAEAAESAAAAARETNLAEHSRVLAEVRAHLDEERSQTVAREAATQARAERRAAIEAQLQTLTAELDELDLLDGDLGARERRQRVEEAALEAERQRQSTEREAIARSMARELSEIEARLDARAQASAPEFRSLPIGVLPVRRVAPRFEIQASVLIGHDGESAILPLRNVSLTGALISLQGGAAPLPHAGSLLFLTLFSIKDPTRQIDLNARIVRKDTHGIAVDWSEDQTVTHAVAVFIDELSR